MTLTRTFAPWLILVLGVAGAGAAELPPHHPLRILIVSDEVNPHGLSAPELTQPGDLSAAITAADSGLVLDTGADAVLEIATNQIELATAALGLPFGDPAAYDVLLYFAHRIPDNGNDAAGRQAAFVTAVDAFLVAGGGVVSFHHGAYLSAGKEAMMERIGAEATGAVPWNTVDGQNVINVSPGHFVTSHAVEYAGALAYVDPARGVPASSYPFFNNTPDERYINFDMVPAAGELEVLFGSDYDQNGTSHLLGFVHRHPGWLGVVVAYQPGEYQPQALDDRAGNNFQILANAIVFAADAFIGDGIVLSAERGGLPGEVSLSWISGGATFTVFQAPAPVNVGDPLNELGSTAGHTWTANAGGDAVYFLVTAP